MTEKPGSDSLSPDTWESVNRGLEYEGEERANLLRIVAIGAFYGVQLMTHSAAVLGYKSFASVNDLRWPQFHTQVTILAAVWVVLALGLAVVLRSRIFPPSIKYLSTGVDLLLLTGVLLIADGPRSPIVVGFFVIIALSALRFRLRLVWFATAGAVLLYLAVNVYASRLSDRDISVAGYQQTLTVVAFVLEGAILGEIIRKMRRTSRLYALRQTHESGDGT